MTGERGVEPVVSGPDAEGFRSAEFRSGFPAFFGRIQSRAEGETRARVRVETGPAMANVNGDVHGGFTLAFLDQALFVGPIALGRFGLAEAVTLGTSTQFVGAARIGRPLDCIVDIARQTRQLMFLTGWIEQDGAIVLTYQATLRVFAGERAR